jgi:excisionase family DNA binding protein
MVSPDKSLLPPESNAADGTPAATLVGPFKRLLTKEQVCHELGISANTLTEWMKDGTVPFLRYGRRVYFEWHQLLAAGRAHAHQDQQG